MASFRYKTAKDIAVAPLIAELSPPSQKNNYQKSDRETCCCAFAPDESLFVWSCGNRRVVLVQWDASNSRPLLSSSSSSDAELSPPPSLPTPMTIDCGHLVWSIAVTFSGQIRSDSVSPFHCKGNLLLATGLSNSRIRIWDASTGKLIMELMDHKDVITDLAFPRDGSLRLVSASRDMTLKVWDLKDGGNLVKTMRGHRKWVLGCCWAPNSRLLASVGSGKMVLVWNMEDNAYSLRHRLEGHTNDVVSCHFSPDSALLATASSDTRIIIWDPYVGHVRKVFGHVFPPPRLIYASSSGGTSVRGVRFSSDGCHLASIADDGFVRFWNLFLETPDPVEVASLSYALCCAFSPSGSTLAVGTRSGSVSFFRSPSTVLSLKRMCRVAVRSSTPSSLVVDQLDIPKLLHSYLQYSEWH